jgi:hypothetical protein
VAPVEHVSRPIIAAEIERSDDIVELPARAVEAA